MQDPYVAMALNYGEQANNVVEQFTELAEAFKKQCALNSNFEYEVTVRQDGPGHTFGVRYLNYYEYVWEPCCRKKLYLQDKRRLAKYLFISLLNKCINSAVYDISDNLN